MNQFRSEYCFVIWHIQEKTFLHFTWDMICCNFIFISKASANCNSQVGMTSVDANLLKKRFFFFKALFIFSAPHCEVPPMLCFSEAGLEHRWEKKGMKFYTLKHSVNIYIVSLVTWRLYNTLQWRISKAHAVSQLYKFLKLLFVGRLIKLHWKWHCNKQKGALFVCLFVCFVNTI